jgi:sugar phosphate isomerase/epimerase
MNFLYSAFADESSNALAGQIDALKRNNFQYLEIRSIDKKNVSDLTLQEAREKNAALRDNGLSVWSIGSRIGKIKIADNFEEHLDLYKHTLDIAGEFGADEGLCGSGTDQLPGGPAAQHSAHGVDDDGLTGAGLARQGVEPREKPDVRLLDDGNILDVKQFQHVENSFPELTAFL